MNELPVSQQNWSRWSRAGQVMLALLICAIYGIVLREYIRVPDYPSHIYWAQELSATGKTWLPHYLFQQVTIIVHALIPFQLLELIHPAFGVADVNWRYAGIVSVLIFTVALGDMIYRRLLLQLRTWDVRSATLFSLGISLMLLLVGPITLLTWQQRHLYFGYIGLTVYHNPTILLLKPLALFIFWWIMDRMDKPATLKDIVILAAVSVLALHTKPNFTLAFLPTMGLLGLYWIWRRRPFNWRLIGFGFIIPSVLFLLYQSWILFSKPEDGSITLAPFFVVGHFIRTHTDLPAWVMAPLFFLSCAFPLGAALLYPKKVFQQPRMTLAWLAFAFGVAATYLIAESGRRSIDGNFLWTAQITLFVLFVETILALMRDVRPAMPKDWRAWVLITLWMLHLVSGLFFYVNEYLGPITAW